MEGLILKVNMESLVIMAVKWLMISVLFQVMMVLI